MGAPDIVVAVVGYLHMFPALGSFKGEWDRNLIDGFIDKHISQFSSPNRPTNCTIIQGSIATDTWSEGT